MIWAKVFGRTSILEGWFVTVWNWWSSIFSKHPFCQVAFILFILFFKSYWGYSKSVVRHGIEWIPYPKQQLRPLPFLMSVSSSMLLNHHTQPLVIHNRAGHTLQPVATITHRFSAKNNSRLALNMVPKLYFYSEKSVTEAFNMLLYCRLLRCKKMSRAQLFNSIYTEQILKEFLTVVQRLEIVRAAGTCHLENLRNIHIGFHPWRIRSDPHHVAGSKFSPVVLISVVNAKKEFGHFYSYIKQSYNNKLPLFVWNKICFLTKET